MVPVTIQKFRSSFSIILCAIRRDKKSTYLRVIEIQRHQSYR